MKYLSFTSVKDAFIRNSKSTSSKFWGLLAIISSIKEDIIPGKSYSFPSVLTSQFLESLFCFGKKKLYDNSKGTYYVMFSQVWLEKVKQQMCLTTPSFINVAVWYFRNYEFSDEHQDGITSGDLQKLFSEHTGLSIAQLKQLFGETQEEEKIELSDVKTEDALLLDSLSEVFENTKGYSSITPEGSFIKANPGELSRAPFIQTIYASQQSTECLLLTQFPFASLYNQEPKSDTARLIKRITLSKANPLQQIFFGAPGTGKSHTIKEVCKTHEHFRITFHPDTDYASFVGAYKPTTMEVVLRDMSGHPIIENGVRLTEEKIAYKFVRQAFLKAYVAAWKEQEKEEPQPVFLVIEEINRGNCAQIFGDIFQLLDRNEEGFSDYPIHADTDLSKELGKVFADLRVVNAEGINALYDGKDIVGEVKKGTQLLLPNNLYIWATMNTSDQSLFPIDSAFKRRWDWKYMKIADSGKGYVISVNGKEYDWWKFLQVINKHIGDTTSQEDKKLGYFFVKAAKNEDGKHVISAEKFLSKVLFFLYGDVYKDYGFDDSIFKGEDGVTMEFSDYFDESGKAIESKIETFLLNLGVEPIGEKKDAGSEDNVEDVEVL